MQDIQRDIILRPDTEDDAGDIARIHLESWQSTYAGILPDEILLERDSAQHEAWWWRHVLGRFRRDHFVYVEEERGEGTLQLANAGSSRNPTLIYKGEILSPGRISRQRHRPAVVPQRRCGGSGSLRAIGYCLVSERKSCSLLSRAYGRGAGRPATGTARHRGGGRNWLRMGRRHRTNGLAECLRL